MSVGDVLSQEGICTYCLAEKQRQTLIFMRPTTNWFHCEAVLYQVEIIVVSVLLQGYLIIELPIMGCLGQPRNCFIFCQAAVYVWL